MPLSDITFVHTYCMYMYISIKFITMHHILQIILLFCMLVMCKGVGMYTCVWVYAYAMITRGDQRTTL